MESNTQVTIWKIPLDLEVNSAAEILESYVGKRNLDSTRVQN